ncbi:MAG: glycoside hydrolase family 15 protein, partial [Actinomycetota bacterium]|nr:glycoside hydrolase family 15 protein [Actinomycetota bacterium]
MRIEDYALIGDLQSAALVGRNGSVDWLCLPRFDSASCFSALLGDEEHGRWLIAPADEVRATSRRYRPGTLVLETDFECAAGRVRVVDFMPRRGDGAPQLVRIVHGLEGRVPMKMELALRPDYASIVPWVDRVDDGVMATAGPDGFHLSTPLDLRADHHKTVADFHAIEGARERFVLSWYPSYASAAPIEDADSALARTEAWWRAWSARCAYNGEYRDEVVTSLITLKAMTDETTGALVAAPTTSLPEDVGGVRNWDYRYCWLRDAVLTLNALLVGGYTEEALAFRDFVLRVGTGDPSKLQIMYGIAGERRLTEFELDWLPGYEGSKPVRVGNAASEQFQLDVYGEVIGVAAVAAEHLGFPAPPPENLPRWSAFIEFIEQLWQQPDDGIWEARGPRRHFTHSKVMAWVVFEAAVGVAERLGLDLPVDRWKRVRKEIHDQVCEQGYDAHRNTFTQYYGSKELDASTLIIPLVGFLPGDDERVTGTIDAVSAEL